MQNYRQEVHTPSPKISWWNVSKTGQTEQTEFKTDCKELTEKKFFKYFERDKTDKPDRSHRKRDREVDWQEGIAAISNNCQDTIAWQLPRYLILYLLPYSDV